MVCGNLASAPSSRHHRSAFFWSFRPAVWYSCAGTSTCLKISLTGTKREPGTKSQSRALRPETTESAETLGPPYMWARAPSTGAFDDLTRRRGRAYLARNEKKLVTDTIWYEKGHQCRFLWRGADLLLLCGGKIELLLPICWSSFREDAF